ncbi:MAG TPA: hypothetical protein VIM83_00425 [Candidatus Limnocylindria bacterium]
MSFTDGRVPTRLSQLVLLEIQRIRIAGLQSSHGDPAEVVM